MSLPHAVIIAGGQGQRLGGVRKGDLKLGNVRLIDRVTAALGMVAAPLLVATGHGSLALPPGAISVPDLNDTLGGPLAGLAAAVDWLAEHGIADGLLVSTSVDTPFLPADFVAVVTRALESHAAVFAQWGNDFYPPQALWRLSAIATLPARVRAGTAPKSLKALLGEIAATTQDWQGLTPLNPFENLNTMADMVRLGRSLQATPTCIETQFPQARLQ
jgi:molybdopterin-guanine dinucleotide biosynthesis protein A